MIINGQEIYTVYDAINKQISLGVWDDTTCLAQRNMTLDFYFRLYSLVRKYFPNKPYGYKRKLLKLRDENNSLIISKLGGGIGRFLKKQSKTQSPKWRHLAVTDQP